MPCIGPPLAGLMRPMLKSCRWARENQFVVFTNDLDFGAILAHTQNRSPSVIQVRTQDVSPEHLEELLLRVLVEHQEKLLQGALITLDEARARIRVLPL